MKRFLVQLVIFLLIGESTGLFQLAKLPFLYKHYIEHKDLNEQLRLVDYLVMHYWGDDMNDDDDEKDMQLPFKRYEVAGPVFLFVKESKVVIGRQVWVVETDFPCEQPECYFNPAGKSLFRPPRA